VSEPEIGVEEARKKLGDLVDDAALDGAVTYLTRRGRRYAAIVPADGVPLRLTEEGPGSRASIEEYVQEVIAERTVPNDDTTVERLARNITTSILHRLGAGYSVATGSKSKIIPQISHSDPAAGTTPDP
jgi:prevent-host-death family protein